MSDPVADTPAPESPPGDADQSDAILRLLDQPITPEELRAGTELAASPAISRGRQDVRLLLLRIGDEIAAIPAMQLRRATLAVRPTPIPHRSGGVLRGMCNIRGELVLCADLHRLLGMPPRASAGPPAEGSADSRRIVVIGKADDSWAFEVDALMGVENVDRAEFRSPPVTVAFALADFTSAVADIGGRTVTILDGDRILAGFKAALA